LATISDNQIARFNLNEKTNDKCHYFIIWYDEDKGAAVMQYKLYRHAAMLYPRKYMEGMEYAFDGFGLGKVTSTTPKRDAVSKEKFWLSNVVFKMQDKEEYTHTFTTASNTCAIQILYPSAEKPLPTADCFPLASFDAKFSLEVQETLKINIRQMMQKCNFTNEEAEDWELFLSHIPENVCDIKADKMSLPTPQHGLYRRHSAAVYKDLPIDPGLRPVDVVTHKDFASIERKKALKALEDATVLQPLDKGDFVVVELSVSNCPTYKWNFVVAQIIGDVDHIDTTDPEAQVEMQIYRPSTLNKLDSKFVQWIGDTNKPWKGVFSRGHVKAIVERQVQGKKLTAKSQKLIQENFLNDK
jgi:hypothetical protein